MTMYLIEGQDIFQWDCSRDMHVFLHSLTDNSISECGDSVLLAAAICLAGHTENTNRLRYNGKVYSIPYQDVLEDMLRPHLYTAETSKYGKAALEVFINYCEVK